MKRFLTAIFRLLIFAGAVSPLLSSCNKDDDKNKNSVNPALTRTFYVAGSENSDGVSKPVVWVNGIARVQGNSATGGICNSVATGSDNSIYAGVTGDDLSAGIYKNGELLFSLDKTGARCSVEDVALLNDIVYSCGYDEIADGQPVACVWQGHEKYMQTAAGGNGIRVFPVNENEIYLVADEYGNTSQPAIYRNNSKLYSLPSPDGIDTYAKDAFYINGDIYTVGEYAEYPPVYKITVWKNDIKLYEITGSDGANCNAEAIFVNRNGNVFVGGHETNEEGAQIAKIWKDGLPYYELDGGADRSYVTSITEMDGLLYASGETYDWNGANAIIWQENAILYKMKPAGEEPVTKQLIIK